MSGDVAGKFRGELDGDGARGRRGEFAVIEMGVNRPAEDAPSWYSTRPFGVKQRYTVVPSAMMLPVRVGDPRDDVPLALERLTRAARRRVRVDEGVDEVRRHRPAAGARPHRRRLQLDMGVLGAVEPPTGVAGVTDS